MSQNNVDFSGNPSGDGLLDDYLTGMQDNILTCNSGLVRPSYAKPGTFWIDKTTELWLLKQFDGVSDCVLGELNIKTHTFIPSTPMNAIGDVITLGIDGKPVKLSVGIKGTVLMSNGPGKTPSYQTVDLSTCQKIANMSQTVDGSATNYPSNKAVQEHVAKNIGNHLKVDHLPEVPDPDIFYYIPE